MSSKHSPNHHVFIDIELRLKTYVLLKLWPVWIASRILTAWGLKIQNHFLSIQSCSSTIHNSSVCEFYSKTKIRGMSENMFFLLIVILSWSYNVGTTIWYKWYYDSFQFNIDTYCPSTHFVSDLLLNLYLYNESIEKRLKSLLVNVLLFKEEIIFVTYRIISAPHKFINSH